MDQKSNNFLERIRGGCSETIFLSIQNETNLDIQEQAQQSIDRMYKISARLAENMSHYTTNLLLELKIRQTQHDFYHQLLRRNKVIQAIIKKSYLDRESSIIILRMIEEEIQIRHTIINLIRAEISKRIDEIISHGRFASYK